MEVGGIRFINFVDSGPPSVQANQWDVHKLSLFLLTPPWAKGTNISPKALHRPLLLHNQVGWAKACVEVEVETRDHKLGLQGPRGVSTPSHQLSLHIIRLFRVHFYSIAYGQEYCLILVHLIPLLLHHV